MWPVAGQRLFFLPTLKDTPPRPCSQTTEEILIVRDFVSLSIQLCRQLSQENSTPHRLERWKTPIFLVNFVATIFWRCSCFIHFIEFAMAQNSARHWSEYDSDLCMVSARSPTGKSKTEFKSSSRPNISWNLRGSCAWASRYLPSKFASSGGLSVISSFKFYSKPSILNEALVEPH